MKIARRALLIGAACLVSGCVGDPRIKVRSDATRRVQEPQSPKQLGELAKVASCVGAVRMHVEQSKAGSWRTAVLAQCDDQLARLNSVNPFTDPDPVFSPTAATSPNLQAAITTAAETCVREAQRLEEPSLRLLLLSIAAATRGVANTAVTPAEGTAPSPVAVLRDQHRVALTHVWALIYGIESALGNIHSKDPLFEPLTARLASAKTLRDALRSEVTDPSQPASFSLPGTMSTPDEIRAMWQTLEVNLLEALVLLAAQSPGDDHWVAQLQQTQSIGGRIPRWPGWN